MSVEEATVLVSEAVGAVLARSGVDTVFGVLGDGNLRLVEELTRRHGVRYLPARHECTAVAMADGYARIAHRLGVATVTQGPGVTNAVTALTEAVKAHTPLLLLTGDVAGNARPHNQSMDQAAVLAAIGVAVERPGRPAEVVAVTRRAVRRAVLQSRPVAVCVPNSWQDRPCPADGLERVAPVRPARTQPDPTALAAAAEQLLAARRPLVLAGRGAVRSRAGPALRRLAEAGGALLATSIQAHGLFAGDPFDLGIAGGFSNRLAADLIGTADLVMVFGASLTHWTTRQGALIAADATIVHCDTDPSVPEARHPCAVALISDAAVTAGALAALVAPAGGQRWRTPAMAERIAAYRPESEYDDPGTAERMDPRTFTVALDRALPPGRTVVVDSGHFQGFPPIYLRVPDEDGFCFNQDFQSLSVGLGAALGAATARPDRLTVHTIGDGGLMMCLGDLETAVRERLTLLVVVYNDAAYGAEIRLLENLGRPTGQAFFTDLDFAAVGRALGGSGHTVRTVADLAGLAPWLAAPAGLMVIDAKIDPAVRAGWFDEAFGAPAAGAPDRH